MADVDIGTIRAKLTIDEREYVDGLKNAAEATKGLNTSSANLATGLYNLQTVYTYAMQAINLYKDATVKTYTEVKQFQAMTGASIEISGKWQDMLEGVGMELGSMTYAFRGLSNNMQQALDPSSNAAKVFSQLGVNVKDSNGKLRDTNIVMMETLTALQKLPAGAERTSAGFDTIGRGVMSLNTLLDDGISINERWADSISNVDDAGMVKFKAYNTALNKFNDNLEDLESKVGEKILPAFTTILDVAIKVVDKLAEIITSIEYMGYLTKEFSRGNIAPGTYYTREEYLSALKKASDALAPKPKVSTTPTSKNEPGWETNPYIPKEGKASGGSVFPGKSYIVGEEGPELFNTSISGTIIPINKSNGKSRYIWFLFEPTFNKTVI